MIHYRFPGARIRVRLDGGFAHPDLLDFLDGEANLEYVIAMAKNAVLKRKAKPAMRQAQVRCAAADEACNTALELGVAAVQAGAVPRRQQDFGHFRLPVQSEDEPRSRLRPGDRSLHRCQFRHNDRKFYLVGSGIALLVAAALLIRDGDVPGRNILILEGLERQGGSLGRLVGTISIAYLSSLV
jgi:hypothetical protein